MKTNDNSGYPLGDASERMRARASQLNMNLSQFRDYCTQLMCDLMVWHEGHRNGTLRRAFPSVYAEFFPESKGTPPPAPLRPLPDVWYFGWSQYGGHALYRRNETSSIPLDATPFGRSIDGSLCPQPERVDGRVALEHRDGWTAVAFWDRSGDKRPGSNTVFLTRADCGTMELLAAAKAQWAHVFNRPGFPLNRADNVTKPTI